jgi:pentatricopeptide repeat protein
MGFQSTQYDRYGNALGTRSAESAKHYNDGIDRYLAGGYGYEDCMEQAIAADEGFALAHVALARFNQFRGHIAEGMAGAKHARALAAGTSKREQQHVDIVATAIEGRPEEALARTKEHVQDFPTDAFVLSQSSGVYSLVGFSGHPDRNEEQLALLEPLAGAYGDDWWYLCNLAFAENELFMHDKARRHAERSMELFRQNGHGAHTVAHIQFETGEVTGGSAFLAEWRPGYDRRSQLNGHLAWHHALFELLQGNLDEVDRIYHEEISPGTSTSAALGLIADAASLLWRRGLAGETLDGEWAEVRDFAAQAFQRPGIMFADVHCALAYAAAGDEARLGTLIQQLRERAAAGKIAGGAVVPALTEAIALFARGEFSRCIAILEPLQPQIIRIGGSHAQREVFEDTLLEAYFRAGRFEAAEGLLKERVERRLTPRDQAWMERVRSAVA